MMFVLWTLATVLSATEVIARDPTMPGRIVAVAKGNGDQFYRPGAIAQSLYAHDLNDTYLVVDANALVKISNTTRHWIAYDRTGLVGNGDLNGIQDGSLAESRFNKINSFVQSSDGEKIYVTDSSDNCVWLIDRASVPDGTVSTLIGKCGESGNNQTGNFTETRFESPRGIALSPDERTLYVADYYNDRILVADLINQLTSVINLDESLIPTPVDLQLSHDGQELYMTLSRRGLYKINQPLTAAPTLTLVTDKVRSAESTIALSEDGRLIAIVDIDGDQIIFHDLVTDLEASFCVPPNFGVTSSTDGSSEICTMIKPHAITFATQNTLLVTEHSLKNIRRITLGSTVVTTADPSATTTIKSTSSTTPRSTAKRTTLPYPGQQTTKSSGGQRGPVAGSRNPSGKDTPTVAITVGIIVPVALIGGLIGALVFVVLRMKRRQQKQHQEMYSRRTRQGGVTGPGFTADPNFADAIDYRMSNVAASEPYPPSYSSGSYNADNSDA